MPRLGCSDLDIEAKDRPYTLGEPTSIAIPDALGLEAYS
jgi:hypothetical protein